MLTKTFPGVAKKTAWEILGQYSFQQAKTRKVTTPLLCWHLHSSAKHSPVCYPFMEIQLPTPGAPGSSG